jgi:hypothetical protein
MMELYVEMNMTLWRKGVTNHNHFKLIQHLGYQMDLRFC